jgi:uncharacterized SAM-binding protein YcdF (DUF218 family)
MKRLFQIGIALAAVAAGLVLFIATGSRAGAQILELPLRLGAAPSRALPRPAVQAIVVLTGPEERVLALGRIFQAAKVHRETGLPIMVCGKGAPAIQRILEQNYAVRTKWIEEKSVNTFQNAQLCAPILKQSSVRNILLVTDEYHLWRARTAFGWGGISAIPAPSSQLSKEALLPSDFLPSAEGQVRSIKALHELVGIIWYVTCNLSGQFTAQE